MLFTLLWCFYFQDQPIAMDAAVQSGRLENGLQYFVRANHRPENRAELRLIIKAGSILEDEDQRGFAHFVEHMAFNGTEHFEKQALVDYLEGIGMRFGPDLNAYTSFDETVYMLQVPTDKPEILSQAFQILEDWAHLISFEDEEIEKERGVVLEEWRLGRGARMRLLDKQLPVFLHNSHYADRLPIGDPKIIEHGDPAALKRFYKDWYRPDLMAVVAVGDFEPASIIQTIKTHFSQLTNPEKPRKREEFGVPGHDETLFSVLRDPEVTRTSLGVILKGEPSPQGTVSAYRKNLMISLAFQMANQRFSEKSKEADPDFLGAGLSSFSFTNTSGGVQFSAAVREDDPMRGFKALLKELERLKRHGFIQAELDRVKADYLRYMESALAEKDKTESSGLASELVRHVVEGESVPGIEREFDMVKTLLPGIELSKINTWLDAALKSGSRVVWSVQPEKEGVAPIQQAELETALAQAGQAQVAAYQDNVIDQPLLAQQPVPGTIVKKETYEELGVSAWTLSNGVTVVLKPTDFKNDEVYLSAFGPGGSSLGPDSWLESLSVADNVVGRSGAGPFDPIALEKFLSGKVAGVQPYIGTYEQGFSGYASPRDMETLFQLVWAYGLYPRKDETVFKNLMEKMRESVANRLSDPGTVFGDALNAAATQNHPRFQPFDLESLKKIDLDKCFEFYQQRFSHYSGWTFVLVGNFELSAMEDWVVRYVASLPAGTPDTYKDLGVKRPEKPVEVVVKKGQEPKATVRLTWFNDFKWDAGERMKLNATRQILEIMLRESLREDKGGVYGVFVGGSPERIPKSGCTTLISFTTDPNRVDELLAEVDKQKQSLIEKGPSEENLHKVIESTRRSWEVQLRENRFWLSVLAQYWRYGDDPHQILKIEDRIALITAANIQQVAKEKYQGESAIKGLLLPAETSDK